MCDVGVRTRVPPGTGQLYRDGLPVTVGAIGTVIGHVGKLAIVTTDEMPGDSVLVPDTMVRPLRGSTPKPVVVMPGGRVSRLSRDWPRVRTRNQR